MTRNARVDHPNRMILEANGHRQDVQQLFSLLFALRLILVCAFFGFPSLSAYAVCFLSLVVLLRRIFFSS